MKKALNVSAASTPMGSPTSEEAAPETAAPKEKTTPTRSKRSTASRSRTTKAKSAGTKPKASTPSKAKASEAGTSDDIDEAIRAMIDKEQGKKEGTAQLSVRIPTSLKIRLKAALNRADLSQEGFVSEMLRKSLDRLEAQLDALEAAEDK